MSCEYWPPKSSTSTSSWVAAASGGVSGTATALAASTTRREPGRRSAGPDPLVTPSDAGAALAADWAPMPIAWSRWSCLPSVCSDGATMTSARWKSRMSE